MEQEESRGQTQQCRYCGTDNKVGDALCKSCKSPLTAYAGQITGEASGNQEQRQREVALLSSHPLSVKLMVGFQVLYALMGPLAKVIRGFASQPKVNEEGTNYVSASFGSVGPILTALFLVPIALALFVLAWGTWTQRSWAWIPSLVVVILVGVGAALSFSFLSVFWIGMAGVLLFFWFKPEIRKWFGA